MIFSDDVLKGGKLTSSQRETNGKKHFKLASLDDFRAGADGAASYPYGCAFAVWCEAAAGDCPRGGRSHPGVQKIYFW